ncbi:MAG: DUF624 domain-containing protein [Defluviitaleaceae bacterium]|nr:DUF624 domain-containing protein [Defluviitaleaceae bacterium]
MNNFFSTEGKYYKFSATLADILIIGFLWTIFSLGIITIGASTTAMYYVCTKKVSKIDGYLFKDFIKSFKENFLQSTAIFFIILAALYIIWLNFSILNVTNESNISIIVYIALYFVLIQIVFICVYIFPILSRFRLTIFGTLKSAFFMANANVPITIANLLLFVICTFVSWLFPVFIIFIVGLYIYISSYSFVKIFKKHNPDFDKQ